jgi:heat-inducible transcriptional repressor
MAQRDNKDSKENDVHRLDERTRKILQLLVRTHIMSGDPVGSRTLAESLEGKLSSATIRNVMAELEETGYLVQPHTSAGRVPSEKGYRFYVDNLADSGGLSRADVQMVTEALAESDTPEELMLRASYVLSIMSNNVGIVIAPPLAANQLKHIEFLDLGGGRILVIFVSKSGLLQKAAIRVSDEYRQEELDRAGRFLVERFNGRTLTEIRNELLEMMEEERQKFGRMLALLRAWNETLGSETEAVVGDVYVQGATNIINQPEFADIDRMREIFGMFEERSRLVKILNECIASNPLDGVRIAIGSELGVPSMRDFTVITSSYAARENTVGFLGIIGPTRMEYERGISIVGYLGRLVGERIHA